MKLRKYLIIILGLLVGITLNAQYDKENTNVFMLPGQAEDTATASLGLPNVLIENDFNIFFNPAYIVDYGTAYGEIWNSSKKAGVTNHPWGGATFKLFSGVKLGLFIGRPYTGKAINFLTAPRTAYTFSGGGATLNQDSGIATSAAAIAGGPLIPVINGIPNPGFPDFDRQNLYNLTSPTPDNRLDILSGIPLGGNLALGIKLTACWNYDEDSFKSSLTPSDPQDGEVINKRAIRDHHITIGVLVKNLAFLSSLGFAFDYGLMGLEIEHSEKDNDSANNADGLVRYESDGAGSMSFLLRPVMKISGSTKLVSAINLSLINTSTKHTIRYDANGDNDYEDGGDVYTDADYSDNSTLFSIDLALHTQPTESLKVIYSTGIYSESRTIEATGTDLRQATTEKKWVEKEERGYMGIPLRVAVEHKTFSWLKTRLGVAKDVLYAEVSEVTDEEYDGNGNLVASYTDEQIDQFTTPIKDKITVSLGLGIKPVNDVEIDLALATDTYSFNSLISRASVKYHF